MLSLPFDLLSWQEFQRFVLDFVLLLPEIKNACEFGREGDDQKGIDILAALKTGTRRTYQTRNVVRFSPADLKALIADTEVDAEEYVVITRCEVSPAVIEASPSNWTIITGSNLSSRVASLPLHQSRRLVHRYFDDDIVRKFLKIDEQPAFRTPEEALAPWLKEDALVTHDVTFVGRVSEVNQVLSFIKSTSSILLITASGGIGKTRLIYEAHKINQTDRPIFFLDEKDITSNDLKELPPSTAIVVDDAHRRTNISQIIGLLRDRNDIKLILTARSSAKDSLLRSLALSGRSTSGIEQLELQTLSRDEAITLANTILSNESAARQLSAQAQNHPLLTVMLARLAAQKGISKIEAFNDPEFKTNLIARFESEITAEILPPELKTQGSQFLRLVAAFSPLPYNATFVSKFASFLKIKDSEFNAILGLYSHIGLISRRKNGLTLQPDLLSDYLLDESFYAYQVLTGYHIELLQFKELTPELLLGLAELDWRREQDGQSIGAFADAFQRSIEVLRSEFPQEQFASRLQDIAFFQPKVVFEFAENAKNDFVASGAGGTLSKLVMSAGYDGRYTEKVIQFLWLLVAEGVPEAGKQIIELVSFKGNKPWAFAQFVYPIVAKQLQLPIAEGQYGFLKDLLKMLLGKTARNAYYDAGKFVYEGIQLRYNILKDGRKAILEVLEEWVFNPSAKIRRLAVESFVEACRDPIPENIISVSDDDRLSWEEEQLYILNVIEKYIPSEGRWDLLQHVMNGLEYHAKHSRSIRVKTIAQKLVQEILKSKDLDLYLALTDDHSLADFIDRDLNEIVVSSGIPIENYKRSVKELIARYPDSNDGFVILKKMITQAREYKPDHGTIFLNFLATENPQYAWEVIHRAIIEERSELIAQINGAIQIVRRSGTAKDEILALKNASQASIKALYAASLSQIDWNIDDHETAFNEITSLFDQEPPVVCAAVRSLFSAPASLRQRAMIAVATQLANNEESIVSEAGRILSYMLHESAPDTETCRQIINSIERCVYIHHTDISLILQKFDPLYSIEIVEMFLRRIEVARTDYRFSALPFDELLDFKKTSEDEALWARALTLIKNESNKHQYYLLADLYALVARQFNKDTPTMVLQDLLINNKECLNRAGLLISKAPPKFLFDYADFVCRLVDLSAAIDDQTGRETEGYLYQMRFHGSHVRTIGQPSPDDVMIRDKADDLINRLPVASASRKFYSSLKEQSFTNIERDLQQDAEELHG